ncbi:MAG: alkaline phosphatase family protein [Winogradskyella sp.]|uniref:alkaline phosphatase D family protein n=1 Tax=Winogradskyella sp. TaxID=1883156 RepID=UPI000F3B0639|nr:alkaline phosphatase D family protein [Winogradskyella sp.]RNC80182.1 MAG: alkaline phosphatase family protein [Winogradskyella sp.]
MKRVFLLYLLSFFSITILAQERLLKSGPMLGYSGFREVLVWVQTTESAVVKIEYILDGKSFFTNSVTTTSDNDFIAKLYPSEVDYGKTYTYKLYINDEYVSRDYPLEFQTQTLWQYRTDPPDFSFAIGSCFYANETKDDRPGTSYGANYEIFTNIHQKQPDFMVWLGDNVYLRTPDFLTERGIRHRYRHVRATPELQPLLANVHHYATWDDHDYGPNDSDATYANKEIAEKVFNDYWGNLNTNVVKNGGIASHFLWNDVEFFMMDNRYHRDPNRQLTKNKAYLGDEQLEWLINALTGSKATFKIVCIGGQTISDAAVYENYATYPEERQRLIERLNEEKIEGVVFMSGDRHHTEISRLERVDAYPLVDITCSPLTSGIHSPRDEGNTLQVKDKTFYKRNFGIVNVSGERTNRELMLTIYDQNGNKVWDYKIKAKELRYKK